MFAKAQRTILLQSARRHQNETVRGRNFGLDSYFAGAHEAAFDRETDRHLCVDESSRLVPGIHQRIEKVVDFAVESPAEWPEAKNKLERRQVQ